MHNLFKKVIDNKFFRFNQINRDQWIEKQARLVESNSKVLDLGAGTCPYRSFFEHCEYKTADFKQLPKEELLQKEDYGEIDYVCEVSNVPVSDEFFDIVICTEVLEHVPEPILVLQEISRILRPGGKVILTAPLGSGLHQEPYHFYGGFSPYWYKEFLAKYGFNEITIESNGRFFTLYAQETMRFIKMTVPWILCTGALRRLLWTPVWLLLLPWFTILIPALCFLLNKIDREDKFTIGYHVVAKKCV
jgi:ubiquinone/menaquinone biosynthesis C-methylase UbiE